MLTLKQKSDVYERVEYFVNMGNEKLSTDLEMPHVKFDKRGTCGGTAWYAMMELNFNAGLMVDNWDEYMNQVIPHEVAHLFKEHVYGSFRKGRLHSPHGIYWQRIMVTLGVNPDRCHSMDTSKVAQPKKKFVYACTCGCGKEVVLSSVRHNRMVRGTHNYQIHRGHKLVLKARLGKMSTRKAIQRKNEGTKPAQQKKAAMAKKPAAPKQGTKIARAMEVYKAHYGESRQTIIGQIALTLGLTDHQAAGYYQNCKKRVEA
jgi:SprT protein